MAVSRTVTAALTATAALVLALAAGTITYFTSRGDAALAARPLPAISLPPLDPAAASFSPQQLHGEVWVMNLWASWCVPCRDEHPVLLDLARRGGAPVVGVNHRDTARAAKAWLGQYGDPFRFAVADTEGRLAAAIGLSGVPATLVVDQQGFIRQVHSGPVTRQTLEHAILPLIRELQR
jgi:cytochrome c biogenesis protein CcmG, thiol:disulfide interchange protein DsbE